MYSAEFLTAQNTLLSVISMTGAWVLYQLFVMLYNLSPLHPLSHIPGPLLARASFLPEFYYDFVKYGKYTKQIQRMHDEYGPIIRINPNEVHCNDIEFVDEIYTTSSRKRNKPLHLIRGVATQGTAFGTVDHGLHRYRRGPVAKFFSRSMIAKLENEVHGLAQALCDKLLSSLDDEPFDTVIAYSCFTSDVISSYCFGESFGFLDQKGWYPNFHRPEMGVLSPVYAFRFFPFLERIYGLGNYFINYLPEDTAYLIRTLTVDVPNKVQKAQHEIDSGLTRDRPTVLHHMLQLEIYQKKHLDPTGEAAALLGAGTVTTSWTLAVITYHLLDKPELLAKLTQELEQNIEDPKHLPPLSVLENLPYLHAVIQEGLRLSYGVSARSSRVPTDEDLVYRGEWEERKVEHTIPRGYAIGMSCVITHHDESIFPDSYSFIPERWLDQSSIKKLERGMFAFSKGSRTCLGVNLAMCELYVGLAALTLRVFPRMQLFDTTEEDVIYDYDMFIPMPKVDSKGVRVTAVPA
ncbi:cytochrome P450 [Hypomontagnella monticulosa]|nr:cytochrome P450 [Hypomontagnella monticulosa]